MLMTLSTCLLTPMNHLQLISPSFVERREVVLKTNQTRADIKIFESAISAATCMNFGDVPIYSAPNMLTFYVEC